MIFEPILQRDGITFSFKLTLNHQNFSVLVDCGWDASLSLDLDPVVQALESVNLVLLTHASISHLGAFAYLYKTCPSLQKIPVYCTYPVMAMGKLATIDAYRATGLSGPFVSQALTVEEIEQCFNSLNLIKYSQAINLSRHKLEGLQITGYNSGHTLGGTIWKIETTVDSAICAIDWNHSKDSHLNGGFLETGGKVSQQLVKPQVLVTSSNVCSGSLKKNRTQFGDILKQTLNGGGSVLVPTSISRVLELVIILGQLDLKVPILFVSVVSKRVVTQASAMLEWMITSIINDWQVKNESPFSTSSVKCINMDGLDNYKDERKIIMCTDEALGGLSKLLFTQVAPRSQNTVVLTQTAQQQSLASSLLSLKKGSSLSGDLPLKITHEVPLQGAELRKYQTIKQEERKQAEAAELLEKRNEAILSAPIVSDDESEEEMQDEDFPRGTYDYTVESNTRFPYTALNRTKTDDYGEVIKPSQFKLEDADKMEIEEELPVATAPKPKKVVNETPMSLKTTEEIVKLGCRLEFVDLNGLTDSRSLAMILGQIAPLTLVVLPGKAEASVQKDLGALVGDVRIEFQIDNKVLNLKLSSSLSSTLHWQQVLGQSRVAHVTGHIENSDEGQLLVASGGTNQTENSFYVGEIKLTELKKKLSLAGYRAEFQNAGVLVCNNKVSVSKQGDGFIIEGGLDDEFYVVRKAVKSFLAQI